VKFSSPLQWPQSYARSSRALPGAPYKVSGSVALEDLERELRLLLRSDYQRARITANLAINSMGRFYGDDLSRKSPPRDGAGVAIYWVRKGIEQVIACDRYEAVGNNIRALGLCIEGMRAMERSGATQVLERVFTGFAALPAGGPSSVPLPPPPPPKPWWEVLGWQADPVAGGMPPTLVLVAAEAMFKSLAKDAHPDAAGGSHERFVELNAAITSARSTLALQGAQEGRRG
jgi:hypothetical protein